MDAPRHTQYLSVRCTLRCQGHDAVRDGDDCKCTVHCARFKFYSLACCRKACFRHTCARAMYICALLVISATVVTCRERKRFLKQGFSICRFAAQNQCAQFGPVGKLNKIHFVAMDPIKYCLHRASEGTKAKLQWYGRLGLITSELSIHHPCRRDCLLQPGRGKRRQI